MDLNIFSDFPILKQAVHGHPLVYLDNAATTQKPEVVMDAMQHYYQSINASTHRGVHYLSEQATLAYEEARIKVQHFIHAKHAKECIFVKNATEGINLVAHGFAESVIQPGDQILISAMEHHSNIVPWQMLCQKKQAHLRVIPMTHTGDLVHDWASYLNPHTKLLAITHVSNALGTLNPLQSIIATAHRHGIPVLVDGAQSAPHLAIDVQALDCDFFVFSGHKVYGPTGIGVLYGKTKYLEALPPYQGGGNMILQVSFEQTTYQDIPHKFEAGTAPVAEAIGLGAALDYVKNIGWGPIVQHEKALLDYATLHLERVPGLRILGKPTHKMGVLSFIMEGIHPHDIGSIVDQEGIAIRTGHHCAMPLMDFFEVPATARASFGMYNTFEDIDKLCLALENVRQLFKLS